MKKLFTFLSRANNNSIGISFNHRRVSFIYSMLTIVAIMLMVPSGVKAEIVTTTYDFTPEGTSDTEVTMSGTTDQTYTNCTYFSKIGSVSDPGRLAADGSWILKSGNGNRQLGLYALNSGSKQFLVSKLYAGDIVSFDVVNTSNESQTISLASGNANVNGNTFTMTEKGSLVVSIARYYNIKKITIKHDNSASYNFRPAIEIYNLNSGNLSTNGNAGFQLGNNEAVYSDAKYLVNQNGTELNNRIAVTSADGWSMNGGLKNNEEWAIKTLAISNLSENDRVVISYNDGNWNYNMTGIYFGSDSKQGSLILHSEAFKDINKNGDLDEDEGETAIKRDHYVEKGATYTMTHDGHLDLIVFPGVTITKIEIYADHRALIENKQEEDGSYTMYFDGTGQIKEKTYMIPGGLKVQFGNDNENQTAYVIASDKGPVSYINDEDGFKMARANGQIHETEPYSGTYYRFIPDVDGKIKFSFKAQSIRYTPWDYWNNGIYWHPSDYNVPEHEQIGDGQTCDYHLYYRDDDNNYAQAWNTSKGNGALVSTFDKNDLEVKAGKVYYLYGTWNGDFGQGAYCGVAELLSVNFLPNKYVSPLAACIDNASPATTPIELASVSGYTTSDIHEKAKSSNITGYTVEITSDNKLKISNITYADGADKAGVILLKLGTGAKDPVFVLTIAYDAAYCSENWDEEAKGYTEGHTWDFSSDPLSIGSYWTNFFSNANNEINTGELTKNTSSQLYNEIENRYDPDGAKAPEWDFEYLSQTSSGSVDPTFINVYDMVGDNADMIWETEGLWFETESNQSCLFNEKQGSIDRTNKVQHDPQRYVGILKGGEFTIPKLDQDDRVLIYMGNSATSGAGPVAFNITNAYDALGTEITSEYRIGGSVFNTWQADGSNHNDPNYQGCYHFIAKGGDMTFKMVGGKVCKIYKIVIYRGNHRRTNDVERYNNGPLVLVNEEGDQTGKGAGFSIHYRGKGERITNPEVIVKTGNLTDASFTDEYLSLWGSATGVSFTSRVGDFGNFRLRLKDMDYSGNYVCDFADRNLTVGYKQKQTYPYTWDFMDVQGWKDTADDLADENTKYPETTNAHESKGWDLSMWDKNGSMIICNPDPTLVTDDNYIFYHDSDKGVENHLKGNQLFANDKIIPETQGLWFYFDNNDRPYNGLLTFKKDGMHLSNHGDGTRQAWWNYKIIVPDVPNGAAVYLRVAREASVSEDDYTVGNEGNVYFLCNSYAFGSNSKSVIGSDSNSKLYQVTGDNSGDYIMAIYNAGDVNNLTLTLNGWVLKKMSVSQDFKKVNIRGWATESRGRVIDPELTAYLTGYDFETCLVTGVNYTNKKITLKRVYPSEDNTNYVMSSLDDGDTGASIIHNRAATTLTATNGEVKIFNLGTATNPNEGFHLFVPDMHDYYLDKNNEPAGLKSLSGNSSMLVAQVSSTNGAKSIPGSSSDGKYTNYALTYKYLRSSDGSIANDANLDDGAEAFYRIATNGASSSGNQGYLPLLTNPETPSGSGNSPAKFSIIFEEEFENINPGITTTIDDIESSGRVVTSEGFYNLNGQKINGIPTQKGMYIVNGKKVLVK